MIPFLFTFSQGLLFLQLLLIKLQGISLSLSPLLLRILDDLIPWLGVFGNTCCRSPRVFLNLFEMLSAISKEVEEKFVKAAEDKKKASTTLPQWGEVYCLGDLHKFYKAPKINESFSRLLSKPVSLSRYVSLSLDDLAKLEACIVDKSSRSLFLFDPRCHL